MGGRQVFKKILLGGLVLILVALGVAWFTVGQPLYDFYDATAPHTAPRDYAKQDDSRVQIPTQQKHEGRPFDPLKNVFWGDVHVHTVESFDAVLFGTTLTIEDA
jgi:hypothetical protein